jgi:ribosomal protein L31
MIQAMTVYVRDAAVEVIHFIEICKLAQEIHNLRLELEQEGHPCYQGDSSALNESGMSRSKFQEKKDELQVVLADWKERVQEVRNEHPRLLMLDRRQLSQLIRGFFVLLSKVSNSPSPILSSQNIISFLLLVKGTNL